MKKEFNREKLSRKEMSSIMGGKTPADCLDACYNSAKQRCDPGYFPVQQPDYQACYYEYLASCSVGCAGWVY